MKRKIGQVVLLLLMTSLLFSCGDGGKTTPPTVHDISDPRPTFIMIHLEAGYKSSKDNNFPPGASIPENYRLMDLGWQEYYWTTLLTLVTTSNSYGFKLTLSFTPEWARFVANSPERLQQVREWKTQGHEIAFHHHSVTHPDWDGYSNATGAGTNPLFLGDADAGYDFMSTLAPLGSITSSVMGGLPVDFPSQMTCATLIFGAGYFYNSYPQFGVVKSLKPTIQNPTINGINRTVVELTIREFTTVMTNNQYTLSLEDALPILQDQYRNLNEDEVFGIVFHEFDYSRAHGTYKQLFDFFRQNGTSVKTMRQIADEYLK